MIFKDGDEVGTVAGQVKCNSFFAIRQLAWQLTIHSEAVECDQPHAVLDRCGKMSGVAFGRHYSCVEAGPRRAEGVKAVSGVSANG